jgi:hypothetical protein
MTLDQFVAAYNGRYLDYDGHFGAQCVDLVDYYVIQVLGVPIVWANAIDWWGKDAAFLNWTRNVWGNASSKPARGDIVVWGANARAGTGVFGHITVCTDPGDGLTFGAFSQNYPTGSACALRRFTYDGVIGWGDKPAPVVVDPCADPKAQLAGAQAALQQASAQLAAYRAAVASWAAGVPK